jgi:FixJ family two-component response regulator
MSFHYPARGRSRSKSPETPVVFVVDPDASTREALTSLIGSAGWEPKTAASAEEFLEFPRGMTASCLLLELDLPRMNGLELQEQMFDQPELPIIFMSKHADVPATVQAVKAGALEFLTKPLRCDVVLHGIRSAIEHSRAAIQHWARSRALHQRYQSLSRREREVMSLIVTGLMNKRVAAELGIAEITVKTHRGRMMRKMQAGSLAELVTMAASLRLRSTPPPLDTRSPRLLPRQFVEKHA